MKSISPNPQQIDDILAGIPEDAPIIMVNLLKFRERALYPDGTSDCSGIEAYARYSVVASQKVAELGGSLFWMGDVQGCLIAPPEEAWDKVMLVQYPSIQAFQKMLAMPDYHASTIHRAAALEDSRLIASVAAKY